MERKVAGGVLALALFGGGWAAGTLSAGRADWFAAADLALRIATLAVFVCGLVGTFAVLTSLRAQTYSQMYGRFQTTLLKLAEHPEWFDALKRAEYTEADEDVTGAGGPAPGHRFVANVLINLYEEAFVLYDSRVLATFDTMSADYWESLLGSMRSSFRLRYVRTQWEVRRACFSPKFNDFVRKEVLQGERPA